VLRYPVIKTIFFLAIAAAVTSVGTMARVRALLLLPSLSNPRSMKSFKLTASTSSFCLTRPRTGSSVCHDPSPRWK
jgi:hypothetical protein